MKTLIWLLTPIILLTFYGNAIAQNTKNIFMILKKLEAKATVGTTYGNYTNAVADAKVEVDSFITSKESLKNPEFRKDVKDVMEFYVLGAKCWNDLIKSQTPIETATNKFLVQVAWKNASRVLKEAENSLMAEKNKNLSKEPQPQKQMVVKPKPSVPKDESQGYAPVED